jgi:hypothetical protein
VGGAAVEPATPDRKNEWLANDDRRLSSKFMSARRFVLSRIIE